MTIFGPIRYEFKNQKEKTNSTLLTDFYGQLGFTVVNESYKIYGSGYYKYKNSYYAYLSPIHLSNKGENYEYSTRYDIFNNQYNQSGIGYENSWVIMQIGRGNENWGAGNDIQLALSENSQPYDYFLLASNYGKVRVRYIHGFLENVLTNINRYISARGFEWTNKKSFLIGFSEIIVYSGENRAIDVGYLNPMSSHLEIELNDRLNIVGNDKSNAVWQMHLDYLIKKLRFSMNILFDEFVIDPDIQIDKEHGRAYSIRLAYTPFFSKKSPFFTLYSSLVYVGTPTFRHGNGTNNFVQIGRPLGWYRGSDGQEICIGMNYFNNKNLTVNISTGISESGEETITKRVFDSYSDYLRGPFPSGEVLKEFYAETNFTYWFREDYSVSSNLYWSEDFKDSG